MEGGNTIPSCVGYKPDKNEVVVGRAAQNQLVKNLDNTIYDAKRMIGKKMGDEAIEELRKYWPFEVMEGRMGKPKIMINVLGVDKQLSPE